MQHTIQFSLYSCLSGWNCTKYSMILIIISKFTLIIQKNLQFIQCLKTLIIKDIRQSLILLTESIYTLILNII